LAGYRGTYNEDNSCADVLTTRKTNFLASSSVKAMGSWMIVWYSVSNMEQLTPPTLLEMAIFQQPEQQVVRSE